MFTVEEGNVISCVICFANARKYSVRDTLRMTFKYFNKVAEFPKPSSFTE